jgi:hypothetical protein
MVALHPGKSETDMAEKEAIYRLTEKVRAAG